MPPPLVCSMLPARALPGSAAGKAGKGNGHVPVAEGGSPFFLCLWPGAEPAPCRQGTCPPCARFPRLSCKLFLSCLLCAVGRSVRDSCAGSGPCPLEGGRSWDGRDGRGGGAQSTKEKACGCSLTTQACVGQQGVTPACRAPAYTCCGLGVGRASGRPGAGRPRSEGVLVGPGLGQAGGRLTVGAVLSHLVNHTRSS